MQKLLFFSALFLLLFSCKGSEDCDTSAGQTVFDCARAKPGSWFWTDVGGMGCRDGSNTGIGLRMADGSNKLVIYLQGGGACYDANTCNGNPNSHSKDDFDGWVGFGGNVGLFNPNNNDNPFQDWNMVFIPYCTGDVHWGSHTDSDIPGGPADQDFVGYTNIQAAMNLIGPEFNTVTDVLLTGASAGGYGTLLNYPQVATTFPSVNVSLIDDSGPLFSADNALAPCLQERWRDYWGLDPVLAPCTDCFPVSQNGDSLAEWHAYLSASYPNASFGLIASQGDGVIRDFLGDGQNACTSTDPLTVPSYEVGLNFLVDSMLVTYQNPWSTFLPSGNGHVYASGGSFYSRSIDGTTLAQWAENVVSGTQQNLRE